MGKLCCETRINFCHTQPGICENIFAAQLFMRYVLLILAIMMFCTSCQEIEEHKEAIDPKAQVTTRAIATFDKRLRGTSGLVYWNGYFWSHNDAARPALYQIDTFGHILQRIGMPEVGRGNCEDLAQDDQYFYLGDFGNNMHGSRQNLRIYRIAKADLLKDTNKVSVDSINFTYRNQRDYSDKPADQTNFDCEAMICVGDSLYLFSKQWITPGTRVYAMSKKPGSYTLQPQNFCQFDGLITGATTIPGKKLVVLCGYTTNLLTYLNPFVVVLQDYPGNRFFEGQVKRLELGLPYHQVEAITLRDDGRCFITNEYIREYRFFRVPPKMYEINLKPYLKDF